MSWSRNDKSLQKDPKILDFQSCGSVNNLGNEKIQKSLILPIAMIWGRQKNILKKSKNPWYPIVWRCQYCKKWKNPKILDVSSVIIWERRKSLQNIQKSLNSNGVEVSMFSETWKNPKILDLLVWCSGKNKKSSKKSKNPWIQTVWKC